MDRRVLATPDGRDCPSCGCKKLWVSGDDVRVRAVCERCGLCWDRTSDSWVVVDSIRCAGCPEFGVCESRPTSAARNRSIEAELPDGTIVVVRLLLRSDRNELRDAYDQLSDSSRRFRFFVPPKRLSEPHLEYLTSLDYSRRFALVAFESDDPTEEGLGVARWIRSEADATRAEAAVVVKDHYQSRGLGTALLHALIDEARALGITAFSADVLRDNDVLLDKLTSLGATISPSEPGVASVEFQLPAPGTDLSGTALHQLFVAAARDA